MAKTNKKAIPFDRLPLEGGYFNQPNAVSPYNTERANHTRTVTQSALVETTLETATESLSAVTKPKAHKGIFEHNVITLASALAYANSGLSVVDLHGMSERSEQTGAANSCKIPRGSVWQHRASNDVTSVISFWTGNGTYPPNKDGIEYPFSSANAPRNVGIVVSSGMFILDIDGVDGRDSLKSLEATHGPLPKTLKVLTGSGGLHYYFRCSEDADIRNSASQIGKNIDIRGAGGFCVAPPSIHPTGNFYAWDSGCAPWETGIADAPQWLTDVAYHATKSRQTNTEDRVRKREHFGRSGRRVRGSQVYVFDGVGIGFDARLECIGDNADGFDAPILAAANSYFFLHGANAPSDELFDILRDTITNAEREGDRSRYDTDDYLENRIEQAREFVATQQSSDDEIEQGEDESGNEMNENMDEIYGDLTFDIGGNENESTHIKTTDRNSKNESRSSKNEDDKRLKYKDHMSLEITGPLGENMKQALFTLNRRFKTVNMGGDMVFIRVPDFSIENESRMEFWKEPALCRFHADRKIEVKKTKKDNKGKESVEFEWVNPVVEFAATSKRYSRIDFAPPPARVPETSYNLFHGFQLEPVKGDCSELKSFILDVICAGDSDVFKWVWHWLAHMLQRPGEKPGTALVIHGEGRAGKGTFGDIVRALVHPYAMLASDSEQILGKHAGPMLANSLVCVSEEAFFAGDKRQSDKLKSMVVAPIQNIEPKYVSAFQMTSYLRLIFDGNGDHIVNVENNGSEERFCVMEVSPHKRGDLDYFKGLRQQMEGPELAALAYELIQYDPADAGMEWGDVRRAPETLARKHMGYQSRNPAERALLTAIVEGRFEFMSKTGGALEYELNDEYPTLISTQHCRDFLKPEANKHAADSDNVLKLAERIFGKDHGFVKGKNMIEIAGENQKKNVAYFEFPPANELRDKMRGLGYL